MPTKKKTAKKPAPKCTVFEVRVLVKVRGSYTDDDHEITDQIDTKIVSMIDAEIAEPAFDGPSFVDAAASRVSYHGKDFG